MERLLHAEADTERLGAALAGATPWSAVRSLVVFLHGELGAGKTTLARGALRALGEEGIVRSPSYTLLESYEASGHRVLHLDLYRLGSAAEVAALGLRDELGPGSLLLVEWPERAPGELPPPDLEINLSIMGAGRNAQMEAASTLGGAWLAAVAAASDPRNESS